MRIAGSSARGRISAAVSWGLAVVAALTWAAAPARATGVITLTFVPHGAFFSEETHQPRAIDPQVFVKTPGAAAGVGPQNIRHAAGFAPAHLSAPANTPLYNARGKPLHATLGEWLGASGRARIEATRGAGERITTSFTGLIPRGTYSLFEVTFKPGMGGNTFAPLDGTGTSNTFVANALGKGGLVVSTPARLTHANAVLLVYHSDGQAHGVSRGTPGVTAHHQLIARVP